MNFVNRASAGCAVEKNPNSAPFGLSTRIRWPATTRADDLSRKSNRSQHRIPSTLSASCGNRVVQERGQFGRPVLPLEPVEIREHVLDEDLAAELLAEVRDVRPDHGAEIEERGRRAGLERGDELLQRLRGHHDIGLGQGWGGLRLLLSRAPRG